MSYWQYAPYVSVAEKRARAEKKIRQLQKKDPKIEPVIIEGRTLASTWWGKSWNANLERYADYRNRIERGRSYVRHLAVLDLKLDQGVVSALVQGSRSNPYAVNIKIEALAKTNWGKISAACTDQLDSLQDLLAGRFPRALAHLFMQKGSGLFPTPEEIRFSCSCPDWASMCKHVAATLYGIGARLDQDPSLFFMLRQVNMDDLIAKALQETTGNWIQKADDLAQPTIAEADLGNLFGIDMDAMPDFKGGADETQPLPAATNQSKKTTLSPKGKGAIEKAARGVYRAKTAQPKTPSAAERHAAVLKVIKAAPKGIRAFEVAEATGLRPVTVRPVMARLLSEGAIRRISRGVYGPLSPSRKKQPTNLTRAILSMIKNHPKGIGIAALKDQSGYEEKQLRNILFRLFKSGKIRRVGRGIYVVTSQ
jgi:uncharacterized Zn finger protein